MIFYGNPSPDAELVVLYGNCQIPFLARLLAAAHGEKGYLCVLNHAPVGQEADRPSVEHMQRCCLYLEQYDSQPNISPNTPLPSHVQRYGLPLRRYLRENCPKNCQTLVFPSFVLTCLWPFASIYDARNVPEPDYVWGRYPYGNRLALEILDQGLSGDAAFAEYKKRSLEQMPDSYSLLKRTKNKLDKRDAHCDIKIADYVWKNFRESHLFLTYAHTRSEAIGVLALRLYDALHPMIGGNASEARHRLQTELQILPDMGGLEEPIDPVLIRHLGLKFHSPEMRFRWYSQYWTFDEYMTRYLAYDTQW